MAIRLSRRKLASYYAKSLIDGADSKTLTLKLAAYLIESKRTKELDSIIDDIEYQFSLNGIIMADVTSAHNLSEQTKKAIADLINKSTGAINVSLNEHIDRNVFGGLKLEFAGNELDTTLARRITKLKTNYKK